MAITVEPRFNEVPRNWGHLVVVSRVRYTEYLDLTNFREKNKNVRYIEVLLIINLQNTTFPDLNNGTELYIEQAFNTSFLQTNVYMFL